MQQIFIPHSEVNNLVYISKANGIPDSQHPDPLEALLGLQKKNGDQIPNEKSMQVRLLVSRFLDLNLETDYITYTYSTLPQDRIDECWRAVNKVVKDLIDANVQRSISQ